ncbi:flavin reductase family protein [Nocardia brevicatena]|uniref:flavin reductase family protein n=1 Tax=Nocardia brevicatena TaxID=37327 RepID=UPI000A067C01|nr:flavin reductase [Nocardia brevicatena]
MSDTKAHAVAHRLLAPRIAYLIGTRGEQGEPDLIPVSNLTSVSTEPQLIAAAVFKKWQTYRNLSTAAGFTVSVPLYTRLDAVWKLGSKYSGFAFDSTTDKLVASGIDLDNERSAYGPITPSGIGWMSCRIIARIDLSGNHGIFVGEVEEAWFNPEYLHSDGTPMGSVKPVMQQTGNLFTTAADELSSVPYFEDEARASSEVVSAMDTSGRDSTVGGVHKGLPPVPPAGLTSQPAPENGL